MRALVVSLICISARPCYCTDMNFAGHAHTVDADAVPAGETVRAWIPYPRAIPGQQEDIRLVDSSPEGAEVAPESALQRTAYLEKPARAGEPTEFSITCAPCAPVLIAIWRGFFASGISRTRST